MAVFCLSSGESVVSEKKLSKAGYQAVVERLKLRVESPERYSSDSVGLFVQMNKLRLLELLERGLGTLQDDTPTRDFKVVQ